MGNAGKKKKTATWPLQAAIKERLDQELSAKYGIFDYVPDNTKPPYVYIGNEGGDEEDWETKDRAGSSVLFEIQMVSRYKGKKEVLEMQDDVLQALTNKDLELSRHNLKVITHARRGFRSLVASDGETRQGFLMMEFRVQEIPEETN